MTAPEEEDESSKTEEASEHKKQKAKEEGNVALSQDAKSFIMLLGMLFVVWLLFPIMGKWYLTDFSYLITDVDSVPTDEKHLRFLFKNITISFFKIMAVPFLLLMILGIFASIGQTGFIFAPKKLEPNWDKLNIFTGLKKFITMQKIFDSLKELLKSPLSDSSGFWLSGLIYLMPI